LIEFAPPRQLRRYAAFIMTERIFKHTDHDFWLYAKLLLVVIGCVMLTMVLTRWFSDSLAITFAFMPLVALFTLIGRPVTYRQWLFRILYLVLYLAAITIAFVLLKKHVSIVD